MFHQVVTGPPAVAVNIRAGWSMKGVQDEHCRGPCVRIWFLVDQT